MARSCMRAGNGLTVGGITVDEPRKGAAPPSNARWVCDAADRVLPAGRRFMLSRRRGRRPDEGSDLAGETGRPGGTGPGSADRTPDRRDHQGHLIGDLWIGPAPV